MDRPIADTEVGDEQLVDGRAQVIGERLEVGEQRDGRASVVRCERVAYVGEVAGDAMTASGWMYVADPRFTAYWENVAPGLAAYA